jgi:hypothetical protein
VHPKDLLHQNLDSSERIVKTYLEDLDDQALLLRPVEGMNHIAWQLGHLISSERRMVEAVKPGSCPALPENFDAVHGRENTSSDDPKAFCPKAEYLRLADAQRAATKAVLDGLTDSDLDAPGPERMRQMAPTVGAVFQMAGSHVLMHVGQFVGVRRKLKKPVVI